MKTCLIYNSCAGSAAGLIQQIEHFTKRFGVIDAPDAQSVAARVRRAIEDGAERIVVVGGDGTVSQVVCGMAPEFAGAQLAIVPAGTGNDLARSLALPIDDFEMACALALDGDAVAIDVVKLADGTPSYFVNVANGGIGGQVAIDVDPVQKQHWGAFAYWLTSLSQLVAPAEFHLEIEIDDEQFETDVYGVALANGKYVGGGFPIAPDAMLDDGLLDVTLLSVPLAVDLLNLGLRSVVSGDESTVRRARRVKLRAKPPIPFSVDGEPQRTLDATFEVIPRALQVVVGDGAAIVSNLEEPRQTVA